MKKHGVLHGELSKVIAELGHGQAIVVSDYGLPVPKGVPIIDLAISENIPSFLDVLASIVYELPIEKAVVASELKNNNLPLFEKIENQVHVKLRDFSHEELKELTKDVSVIVRTGEWTPYANVILYAGVAF
jgi:D-ribose pyranase